MDPAVDALASQIARTELLLECLAPADWGTPTRCEGWDVADVVLHLAQTNEMAIGSLCGEFEAVLAGLTAGAGFATTVDDGAALMVAHHRGASPSELFHRWSTGAQRMLSLFGSIDLSSRVEWVAGTLSARTLATTRQAETWIHTGDIACALDLHVPPGPELWQIARLAWRTLPYAVSSAGLSLTGPVAFMLTGPAGDLWAFVPAETAVTTITGPATELCDVAARRVLPADTSLVAAGPEGADVLRLVRTYA